MAKTVILCLLAAAMFCTSCSENDLAKTDKKWTRLGLDGRTINQVQVVGGFLYAATDGGLYRKSISGTESFSNAGFEGRNVQSLAVISPMHMMVSLVDKTHQEPPALFATHNSATSWEEIENDFGGSSPEPMFDLATHPSDDMILYASGYQVVAQSTDHGVSWSPIWGQWGGFGTGTDVIEINAYGENEVWAGGQGGIENGYLLRSKDGITWDEWYDLVENPAVVKSIVFNPNDGDEVYAGYEGALIRSRDSGETWQTLIDSEENRFFFGIALSENFPGRIYAAGWLKRFDDPQPLKIFISDDDGGSWEEIGFDGEDFGGVYSLALHHENGKDRLFLGLYRGGVYQVEISE